jgi:Heparinase II/III-like protein/Heparinase II/III N-terminus
MNVVGPRSVFCVIEHMHRSRAVADEVAGGRFCINDVTLDLGLEPDWIHAALPADKEWRLQWSKFYYGLDLAWALQETGDPHYQDAFERLVRSWIAQVPIAFDTTDVIGRRIQNWIYAWNRFAAAPQCRDLDPDVAVSMEVSISEQVRYLRDHLTPERNHRTLELYALFIVALALPHLDPDADLLHFAMDSLHANMFCDILPDGVQRERSTHYHHVVLRSFIGVRENARRFNLTLPGGFDERLARACEFAMHSHRPDGCIPALSDSDTGSYLELLDLAGASLARPDFTYVATRGARGCRPSDMNVSFPDGGYYIQRSGWGSTATPLEEERFLIFDCGPLGDGGHGHYDALNVEIAASGSPLVMDPGRYTYCDDAPHWRRWFKSTAAHNTVTVDDLNQTPYRRAKPKGPVASGRLLQRSSEAGVDLLWGEVRSPAYDAVHRRRVLFVGGEYWLIEDTLQDLVPHTYTLRFHLAPQADGHTQISRDRHGCTVVAPGVVLAIVTSGTIRIENGWIAPKYGRKVAAPVVAAEQIGQADAVFVTLIAPLGAGRTAPSIAVTDADGIRVATVDRIGDDGRSRDQIAWTVTGTRAHLAVPGCDGVVGWRREPRHETVATQAVLL